MVRVFEFSQAPDEFRHSLGGDEDFVVVAEADNKKSIELGEFVAGKLAICDFTRLDVEIIQKYPRLVRALQRQCLLSRNEAGSAIVAHRQGDGRWGGSEAVVHYGGATKCLRDAIRNRHLHNQQVDLLTYS